MADQVVGIDTIKFDPKNARRHNARNKGAIADSLNMTGPGRSIVIDETDTILAGNGVTEVARSLGYKKVRVIDSDRDTLVAVRRSDLTESEKLALALYDNRAGELAEWEPSVLAELQEQNPEVVAKLFDAREWRELTKKLESKSTEDAGAQVDRAAELRVKWQTEPGQVWIIPSLSLPGQFHVIACGDSTDPAVQTEVFRKAVARMVWSDPPYGLGGYAGRSGNLEAVAGDDASVETIVKFFNIGVAPEVYLCCEWKTYPNLLAARGQPRSLIVWAKQVFGMGRGYRRQHEFIGYYGDFDSTTESDLWQIDRGGTISTPPKSR